MSALLSDSHSVSSSLAEVVEINPKIDRGAFVDNRLVSFVPMAAVGAGNGRVDASMTRPYSDVKKGYTNFVEGDVLFAKVTPCMENGKIAIARGLKDGVGCGSTEFHVLRPRAGIDPSYLYHFLSRDTFRREAARHMTGAVGLRRVPASFLESAQIPLPDIERQRSMVAEIEKQFSRLDEAVANLKRLQANLMRFRASVLEAGIRGRLVENEAALARRRRRQLESGEQGLNVIMERRGFLQSTKPKTVRSGDRTSPLPEGWVWATIDQLANVGTGATPKRDRPAYWLDGDVPWVTSGAVNERYVKNAREFVTTVALRETNLTVYPPGTLLVAMYGEGKTRGMCSELRIAATTNQALAALKVDSEIRDYLRLFLDYSYEAMRGAASGGVQPNLNLGIIRAVRVPFPPLPEQRRIVAEVDRRLSIVREFEAEVDANLKRAESLRQAILAKAFSGAHA